MSILCKYIKSTEGVYNLIFNVDNAQPIIQAFTTEVDLVHKPHLFQTSSTNIITLLYPQKDVTKSIYVQNNYQNSILSRHALNIKKG